MPADANRKPTLVAPHGLRGHCRLKSEPGDGSLLSLAYSIRKRRLDPTGAFGREINAGAQHMFQAHGRAHPIDWSKRGRSGSYTVTAPAANRQKVKTNSCVLRSASRPKRNYMLIDRVAGGVPGGAY